jgi:3-oxoadipate enol-lactonase
MKQVAFFIAICCVAVLAGCESNRPDNFQDGFAPVGDGRLYYQAAGAGDVVVLIHGNAGDHRHWNNQFSYLSSDYRVVRYDVRGYGKSSVPVVGSLYSDSSDLAALLDFLEIETAHVVGWSFGSGVAFDFAASYPDRTKSLISVGPWINGHSSTAVDDLFDQMGIVANAVAEGGAIAGSNAFVDIVLGDTIFDEAAGNFMRSVGSEYSWWAFSNPSQAVPLEPDAASRLDELTMPILVMTAENDLPVCREVGDLIADSAPNARQIILPDTGHLLHIERPEAFNDELGSFLSALR